MSTAADPVTTEPSPAPDEAGFLRLDHVVGDADEQASLLEGLDQSYDQLSTGRYSGRVLEVVLDDVELFRERIDQSVAQHGVGREVTWTFATAVSLSGPAVWDGRSIETDTLICFEPRREFALRTPRTAECVGLSVPNARLEQLFGHFDGAAAEDRLHGRSVLTRDAGRCGAVRRILVEALEAAERDPRVFGHAAARQAVVDAILRCIAATLEPVADTREGGADRQTRLARRARDWIQGHIDEAFTITELCAALGCSRRSVQYAFEHAYGMSPVRYIRAVRLNRVRRDLRNPGATTTVQDAAARWGFWHLPRFAREYHGMFGELPSATLRRSRAPVPQA